MSTLGYAILGLLAAQPRTGYDLARLMRTPIGYMWTAHHMRIRGLWLLPPERAGGFPRAAGTA